MSEITTVEHWLGKDNTIGRDIWNRKYRYQDETFMQWLDRVSGGDYEIRQLIFEKKLLFGGRVLSNRGINDGSSLFNCYSAGYCPDDFDGIMEMNTTLARTFKKQGGQGVSMSKLRPKGSPIGKRYKSDGIVPFIELFNQTTATISQGSARKGALLISLDIRHKEAQDFITIKSGEGKIPKANLSLEVDDEFMEAVRTYYETGEVVTLHESREYNGHMVEYDIVPIELYRQLVRNCYDWADPGCLFMKRFRNYNLMEFDHEYEIITGNPCSEQPLKKDANCNLGSLNLSEFVRSPYSSEAQFDYQEFTKAIYTAIRGLDDLIDENADNHALEAQKHNSLDYRNIGLGVMGYGTMLFKLGELYGSDNAKSFTNLIFCHMFRTAVKASNALAKERGTFPKYSDVVWDSTIIQNHFTPKEIEELKEHGLRNCSLISIAPAGTIGTMLGITTGCEPEFALQYKRKTDNIGDNQYEICCHALAEYQALHQTNEIPGYFVTARDVHWKDRVETQAIMQEHVDTAISSTVNLPRTATIEDVERLYLYAWEKGLKGITIYRAGCKREGILTEQHDTPEGDDTPEVDDTNNDATGLSRGDIICVDDDVVGLKRKLVTGCGSLHCKAYFDPVTGELMETFLSKGSTGGCNNSLTGISRLISLASRGGVHISDIVDQLDSTGVCPSYAMRKAHKKDTSKGTCCSMAIGNALKDMCNEMKQSINGEDGEDDGAVKECEAREKVIEPVATEASGDTCPQCRDNLVFEGGCSNCKSCGWSRCA